MKMKVKCSLKDYILNNTQLKGTILEIRKLQDLDEIDSKLQELKIDDFFTEEKVIFGHLDSLRKAVDEHDLVEVNDILKTIGV